MAKQSVFRDFIAALKHHWRSELPGVTGIAHASGSAMPKASTFYLGFARQLELHVFANFQHSNKSWEVGSFTINIILAKDRVAPTDCGLKFPPDDGVSFVEGCYRVGSLLHGKDKWWQLKATRNLASRDAWRASSYSNPERVLTEAVIDVTQDVLAVVSLFKIQSGHSATQRRAVS